MEKDKAIAAIVVLVVVTSTVAFLVWNPPTTPDVKIGYLSQDIHQLALRVAVANGWFEEEGLTVELLQYQNGAYEMDGFQAGQIDMGYLGVAPALVKSISQSINITVLASVNLEGSAISVLKSEYDAGHVTSVADLAGKTIFHPGPATVQNFLLRLALNQSGMTASNVSLQVKRVQDMAPFLTVDAPAFIAWEPFPSLSDYDNITVPLLLSGEIWPNHPCCVVASTSTFLDSNPEIVQKVVDIHVRAEEWIVSHPAEALTIAVDWLGIAHDPVETAFNRVIYDSNVNITGIEMYLEFLIHEGLVEMELTETVAYLASFIDLSFLGTS